ncbi:MAG: hypothetical protein E6I37_11085 [Chloroflexi bacterium]|nr:MAG: hypothetical protein E6I37_11085 [Chloroflexota bacterium]
MSAGSSSIRARLRSTGYAPVLAIIGTILLAVLPWHPTCPLFEGARLPCTFAPPLHNATTLEMGSLLLFTAVLSLLPLEFPNPLFVILLGLTGSAVIITLNFSFEAYFAAVRLGVVGYFNQEARYGLLLLLPSSAALIVAGIFRLVAAAVIRPREA